MHSSLYIILSLLLLLLTASPHSLSTVAMSTPCDINSRSAQEVIKLLDLRPHPEKGYFIETFRDSAVDQNNRSISTQIYYLLEGKDDHSEWHRVDAAEVWHYYAGAPLTLELGYPTNQTDKYDIKKKLLGQEVFDGQHPQVAIEKHVWQRARSCGEWTLVGCTVAPAFVESGFELAPPGWDPTPL